MVAPFTHFIKRIVHYDSKFGVPNFSLFWYIFSMLDEELKKTDKK